MGFSSTLCWMLVLQHSLSNNIHVASFQVRLTSSWFPSTTTTHSITNVPTHFGLFSTTNQDDNDHGPLDEVIDEDDFEILFKDAVQSERQQNLSPMEKVWRYAKKPLLSIGAKGATFSHGNSLRQLLDAHTVVKVRVNTKQFGKRKTTHLPEKKKRELLDTFGFVFVWLPLFFLADFFSFFLLGAFHYMHTYIYYYQHK